MASEIKVTPQNVEMLEEEDPGMPPLDLSDAAVEGLLHSAQMRGYVTNDQNQLVAFLGGGQVRADRGLSGEVR